MTSAGPEFTPSLHHDTQLSHARLHWPQDAPLRLRNLHVMTTFAVGVTLPCTSSSSVRALAAAAYTIAVIGANFTCQLENLPEELLQLIVSHLNSVHLKNAALASRTLYRHASDLLWQNVCLVDKRTVHEYGDPDDILSDVRDHERPDEHDDTPVIEKLYILATNPTLASKVQTLTHRCHLPTPNIFTELPRMYFDADNLSKDERLHKLLKVAVWNMVNVHTLRIVYGHWHLTTALISGFLDHE
jgi:hypothetical protein